MKQVTKYYPDFDSSILFDTAESCAAFETNWKPLYDLASEIDNECSKPQVNNDGYYTKLTYNFTEKFAVLVNKIFPNILKWDKKDDNEKKLDIERFIKDDDWDASDIIILVDKFCSENSMCYNPRYGILEEIVCRLFELKDKDNK